MPNAWLEPVAAGQTRFRMQGLAADGRGLAIGREVLVALPSVEALVAFLGAYSDEASLDDLMPTMTLEQARRAEGGHATLVRCSSSDGYAIDRLARLAVAARGQLYTGTGAVFVRWRDRDAPFGYDLAQPVQPARDEVVVVDVDFLARYTATHRMDPIELIQRLELRAVPIPLGGVSRDPELCGCKEMALLLVAPALAARVLRYLWRMEVPMAGYYARIGGDTQASLLLRLRSPRPRALDVLSRLPGIEILAPVSSRAAVEIGYRHPISLASAQSCLPGDEMFLFRGRVGRVERLDGPPRFVDGRHLVEATSQVRLREIGSIRDAEVETLRVELRMRPSSLAREPRAVVIGWEQVAMLRHLVYMLPPAALATARLVPLAEGLVVLAGATAAGRGTPAALGAGLLLPLGRRLGEVAPGVLVPDGHELWPRVRPALLRHLLGLGPEDHALYLSPTSDPIRIRADQLRPLDAAIVGRIALDEAAVIAPQMPAVATGTIRNHRLGRFALWGFGGLPAGTPRPAGEGEG
jgi:hypothetical protein